MQPCDFGDECYAWCEECEAASDAVSMVLQLTGSFDENYKDVIAVVATSLSGEEQLRSGVGADQTIGDLRRCFADPRHVSARLVVGETVLYNPDASKELRSSQQLMRVSGTPLHPSWAPPEDSKTGVAKPATPSAPAESSQPQECKRLLIARCVAPGGKAVDYRNTPQREDRIPGSVAEPGSVTRVLERQHIGGAAWFRDSTGWLPEKVPGTILFDVIDMEDDVAELLQPLQFKYGEKDVRMAILRAAIEREESH